jgi:protein PET117
VRAARIVSGTGPILQLSKQMQERRARLTLLGAVLFSTFTIWAVHYQQDQEREVGLLRDNVNNLLTLGAKTMYKGVLRDDERRREKMKQREEELQESKRKRALYECVQTVERQETIS